jgi:hypothetical protein
MKNNKNTINTNNNIMSTVPSISYTNADTQKLDILEANLKKTGIYR